MANLIFEKILMEDGSFMLMENTSNILLEEQQNVGIILDYTHVAYVDEQNRTVYVTRGER